MRTEIVVVLIGSRLPPVRVPDDMRAAMQRFLEPGHE
jgi:hypothetical protein